MTVLVDARVTGFGELDPTNGHEYKVDACTLEVRHTQVTCSMFPQCIVPQCIVAPTPPDFKKLRPNFGWMPVDCIKKTLEATTQFYRATVNYPFRKHFKTRFPAANIDRRDKWFATDTYFSDTPAHDDGIPGHGGATMLQLYAGIKSQFLAGYPMHEEGQMPHTLEDFVRKHGAPEGLMSDNAKAQTGAAVKSIKRMY